MKLSFSRFLKKANLAKLDKNTQRSFSTYRMLACRAKYFGGAQLIFMVVACDPQSVRLGWL